MLLLELEGLVRCLEKGQARAVVHLEKSVQDVRIPSGFGFADRQRTDQGQAEEFLVEFSGFLGIPAAVGVVMKTLDHGVSPEFDTGNPG